MSESAPKNEVVRPTLASVGAGYQLRFSEPEIDPGGGPIKIVGADPRRWQLVVVMPRNTFCNIWPTPLPVSDVGFYAEGSVKEINLMFKDFPGLIGGDWYARGTPSTKVYIIEILFMGG